MAYSEGAIKNKQTRGKMKMPGLRDALKGVLMKMKKSNQNVPLRGSFKAGKRVGAKTSLMRAADIRGQQDITGMGKY